MLARAAPRLLLRRAVAPPRPLLCRPSCSRRAPAPPQRTPPTLAAMSAAAADVAADAETAIVAVLVTAPDEAAAQKIADAVVGERLAACANVFCGGGGAGGGVAAAPVLRSTYWWQGKLCRAEPETLMLLKAPARNLPALTRRVKELHPYDEPAISALPVVGGSESFFRWVAAEATAPSNPSAPPPGENSGGL